MGLWQADSCPDHGNRVAIHCRFLQYAVINRKLNGDTQPTARPDINIGRAINSTEQF
jgi:hypothetical protein